MAPLSSSKGCRVGMEGAALTGPPLACCARGGDGIRTRRKSGVVNTYKGADGVRETAVGQVAVQVSPIAEPLAMFAPPDAGFQVADWRGAFTSQVGEYDYWITDVQGAVPDELRGTLFRNGPGRFERGSERYAHMLDGDGYVSAFAFNADGRVHFRSRYVETDEHKAEHEANRVLFRNTFGTQRAGGWFRNAFDMKLKNPANTNIVLWGAGNSAKLLALWEAGPPYEMDPHTLRTHAGPSSMGGLCHGGIAPSSTRVPLLDKVLNLGNAVTAHPHILPGGPDSEPRLATFAWRSLVKVPFGADMRIDIAEYDLGWRRVGGTSFTMSNAFFNPHDFALTPRFAVFSQNPTKFAMLHYLVGLKGPAQCVEIEKNANMTFHVVPRAGGPPERLVTEGAFLIHHANAFEDGDDVVLWSSGWGPAALAAMAPGAGMLGSWRVILEGDFDGIPFTSLWEHRLNRVTGKVTRRSLYDEHNNDHPRVNPHFYSRPSRYVWFNASQPALPGTSAPPQAFVRLDTHTGEAQRWSPGPRCFCEELVFVPGLAGDVVEDDGWLLGMVFDGEANRSALMILDARDFTKGPVARLWLRHHIPHGLHGSFSPQYFGPQKQ